MRVFGMIICTYAMTYILILVFGYTYNFLRITYYKSIKCFSVNCNKYHYQFMNTRLIKLPRIAYSVST